MKGVVRNQLGGNEPKQIVSKRANKKSIDKKAGKPENDSSKFLKVPNATTNQQENDE